ncbi:MAG: PIN domain-containing protein [Bauldia sp.]
MIGLDTNVLVRLITDDDPAQAERAERYLRENTSPSNPAFINCIVLVELEWVLRSVYGYERPLIADALDKLLGAPGRSIEHEGEVREAAAAYRRGKDFAGALIGAVNRAIGCDLTLTFNRGVPEGAGFEVLR